MKKTIHLRGDIKRAGLLCSGIIATILVFSLIGIQSAYAAFTNQLDLGDRGPRVTELQVYLATNASIYPEGLVTGYFGQLTKAAVERFQATQGIISHGTPLTTGYGRVGPLTLARLNAQITIGDTRAPTITRINTSSGNTSATINWTTSEPALSKVYYSTFPIKISNVFDATGISSGEPIVTGTLASYDGIKRSSQSMNIQGLEEDTSYYYLVVVSDSSSNISITSPAFFRTN